MLFRSKQSNSSSAAMEYLETDTEPFMEWERDEVQFFYLHDELKSRSQEVVGPLLPPSHVFCSLGPGGEEGFELRQAFDFDDAAIDTINSEAPFVPVDILPQDGAHSAEVANFSNSATKLSDPASSEYEAHVLRSTPKRNVLAGRIPGTSCFILETSAKSDRKRKHFTQQQREERKKVRVKGQCLRCYVQKLKCSGTRPCDCCQKVFSKAHISKKLRWTACVSSRLLDLNIFEFGMIIFNEKRNILCEFGDLESIFRMPPMTYGLFRFAPDCVLRGLSDDLNKHMMAGRPKEMRVSVIIQLALLLKIVSLTQEAPKGLINSQTYISMRHHLVQYIMYYLGRLIQEVSVLEIPPILKQLQETGGENNRCPSGITILEFSRAWQPEKLKLSWGNSKISSVGRVSGVIGQTDICLYKSGSERTTAFIQMH